MNKIFRNVGALQPGRSVFDLSHDVKLTCDMGQLIPVCIEEMVPGDTFEVGNQVVVRFQPLVAPILHRIDLYLHYFFVPYRLLDDDFEDFITGGLDGDSTAQLPIFVPSERSDSDVQKGTLWDYFGFPVGVKPDADSRPIAFPWRAYNLVYNEYYRDETLQDEVSLDNNTVLYRNWGKDYFTAALPWQQRGIAPALPIAGLTQAEWFPSSVAPGVTGYGVSFSNNANDGKAYAGDAGTPNVRENILQLLNGNSVDLSNATTFNVADLRLAFQIQKWLERNARAGARYVEFLASHFGVSPRDDRLQRPEYVGGLKTAVIVSEVLQTSETAGTPQGNLAGKGLVADEGYIAKYTASEYGILIGIMSIMPKPAYQQGIDRIWLKRTKYDFYFPEFAHLSEQPILRRELYLTGNKDENETIFGYQGRYDEYRVRRSRVCGDMRDVFDYWHLGRKFATPPALNEDFIKCNPSKRIFAVQDEPGLIVNVGNIIKAIRPMPIIAEPGLIDHY